MVRQFKDKNECHAWLVKELHLDPTEQTQAALIEAFVATAAQIPTNPLRLELIIGNWVIKDEDLDLFGTIKDAILTLAGAQFLLGKLGVAGITAVTLSLIAMLRHAYGKGVRISPRQAAVLAILREADRPLSVSELLAQLGSEDGTAAWEKAALVQTLNSLTAVPARVGSVKIVEAFPDHTWGVAGI